MYSFPMMLLLCVFVRMIIFMLSLSLSLAAYRMVNGLVITLLYNFDNFNRKTKEELFEHAAQDV